MTDMELDLTDIDQHLLIEEGIRGGVAMMSHRYALANATGMENYNTPWHGKLQLCISEYPHELHDLRKDYPLALERLQIEENILGNYQCHLLQDEGFSKPPPKLLPNLHNKTNYIIHYRNLKLYLELGLRLTNFDRVLSFDQSLWLKNYINSNTRQRTAAKNDFEIDFFKLMNDAVFGKSFICLFVLL